MSKRAAGGLGPKAIIAKFKPASFKPASLAQAPQAASERLLPMLRAYGGLRHRDTKAAHAAGPDILGRIGALEVRLARRAADVRRAQKLRYHVFYDEMSAVPDATTMLARRDMDGFDAICDHMLVLDHDATANVFGRQRPKVVGTYRLLRGDIATRHGGFYTASEFDISGMLNRHKGLRFLELGRSCVLKPYRNKRTVELLWHGVWSYVLRHDMDAMIGCASLEGTDPGKLALALSFLHHFASAPPDWRARALPSRFVDMNRMPKEAIDAKKALHELPPLIKGYLRLGAWVGEGAVIDHQFGTTDVLMILPRAAINPRYIDHFGPSANRHAA